jgi:hypothetical protein
MRSLKSLFVGLTLIVSGCGGGPDAIAVGGDNGGGAVGGDNGGGANTPPPISSAPGDAALSKYVQSGPHDYVLNASHSGDTYTIKYDTYPLRGSGHTTIDGHPNGWRESEELTLSKNGLQILSRLSVAFYLVNPFVPLEKVPYGNTTYPMLTSSFPLPATINEGDSSPLNYVTYYHDETMSTVDADETTTYSVLPNDSTTLLLCLNSTISGVTAQGSADGLADGTESHCYTVDASGTAALASIALTVDGVELNFE